MTILNCPPNIMPMNMHRLIATHKYMKSCSTFSKHLPPACGLSLLAAFLCISCTYPSLLWSLLNLHSHHTVTAFAVPYLVLSDGTLSGCHYLYTFYMLWLSLICHQNWREVHACVCVCVCWGSRGKASVGCTMSCTFLLCIWVCVWVSYMYTCIFNALPKQG